MFPDEYIHIGGDEVPKHRWDLCPNCQRRIKELGLENSEQLQFWFMNKIKDYCKSLGKQVFMWNWDLKESSALDDDLGFTKCSDTDTGDRPFIDTSTNAYYIDFPYGYTSLKDSANHIVPKGNCVGVEVTMWTEMVPDMAKLEEMSYPRTACVAQMGWHGNCSWSNISYSLDTYLAFLDRNGIKYASIKKANPNWLRGKLQGLWFERRQLTWQGLTNIIDDKKIEKIAKNK
jgi:hexosaminidase